MTAEPITLTCSEGHEFATRVKPGGVTDCPVCRQEGNRNRVKRNTGPRERPVLTPLPGPDEFDDDDFEPDDGEIPDDLIADIDAQIAAAAAETETETETQSEKAAPAEPAHPLPGFLRDGKRARQSKPPAPKIRITAAVRKDVEAKIRFVLVPAGRVWQMRDVPCGSVFIEQEPEISSALAEIVCDSPDLVAWFTGPAGGFMKYFRLAMAVQPVAMMIWAHHIMHAVIEPEDMNYPEPDYSAYPA